MLARRLRRRANIISILGDRLVFAGYRVALQFYQHNRNSAVFAISMIWNIKQT